MAWCCWWVFFCLFCKLTSISSLSVFFFPLCMLFFQHRIRSVSKTRIVSDVLKLTPSNLATYHHIHLIAVRSYCFISFAFFHRPIRLRNKFLHGYHTGSIHIPELMFTYYFIFRWQIRLINRRYIDFIYPATRCDTLSNNIKIAGNLCYRLRVIFMVLLVIFPRRKSIYGINRQLLSFPRLMAKPKCHLYFILINRNEFFSDVSIDWSFVC